MTARYIALTPIEHDHVRYATEQVILLDGRDAAYEAELRQGHDGVR